MKKQCQRCKGYTMLQADIPRPRGGSTTHIIGCEDCQSKGYRDPGEEVNRVYAGTSYRNESPYGHKQWNG